MDSARDFGASPPKSFFQRLRSKVDSVFAHSPKDAILAGMSLAETGLLFAGTVSFSRVVRGGLKRGAGPASAAGHGILGGALILLNCTNYQCVAHNFIHNPFFKKKSWNRAFSVLNSLSLGVPQSLYRVHHFNHHRHGNDRKDPVTGKTKDRSSTYAHGKGPDESESLLAYAFLGPLRVEFGPLIDDVRRLGLTRLLTIETAAYGAFVAAMVALDPVGVLGFYVPVWYLGQVAAYAQNYVEHHRAIPGNRKTDSVSSYGEIYNFVWFNNGYHQEHHFRPQVHWTDIPSVKSEMLPEHERRVVPFAHFVNV